MEYLESVAPAEVPEDGQRISRPGIWTGLVKRVIEDSEAGRVTVIALADQAEYKKMRNGVAQIFRDRGKRLVPSVVTNADGTMRVYMAVETRLEPLNGHPRRPAASGIRPVRHG